jgi:CRP-like cAMP-binding protein
VSLIGETLARHLECFGTLPAEDRAAVVALDGETRSVGRMRDVYRIGDHPEHVVLVLKGFLFRYSLGADGGQQVHSFYLPGEAPDLETLYLDYMDNGLAAAADSEVAMIPHAAVYRVIDDFPEARKLLWRQTLVQAAVFREWLVRNSHLTADGALAHLLCEIHVRAKAAGLADGWNCPLPVSQELVSDALGMTAVHVNRMMQLLRRSGAVEWRGGVLTIRDWDRLSDLAAFDPKYLHLRC